MTICIASDGFPPKAGGIVSFNWHLTNLLLEAGHSVVQLNIDRSPGVEDRVKQEEGFTQVWLAESYSHHKKSWSRYFRPGGMDAPDWIATGLAMRDWLLSNFAAYDIQLIEASDFGGYGAFLSDPLLPPLLPTGHASILQLSSVNHYPQQEESYQLLRQLEKIAYESADAILTHSRQNADEIRGLTNKPVIDTIMPWTKVTTAQGDHSKLGSLQFVGVGALQPAKGIFIVADALRLLKQKGISVQVTWIGEDTYHSPEVHSMAEYLQRHYPDIWSKEFLWVDGLPHESVLRYLNNAQVVILPSLFETFGYTVLEAASFGKAIIVSDKVGAGQHFMQNESIVVVPAGNALAMSIEFEKLANDFEFRQRLGENAWAKLKQEFSPATIVQKRIEAYAVILSAVKSKRCGYHRAIALVQTYQTNQRKFYFTLRGLAKKTLQGFKK